MSERIASLAIHPIALPFAQPYVTGAGTIDRREMAIIEIRGDSGARGWGDAVPMSLRGGPGMTSVVSDLGAVASELAGASISDGSGEEAIESVARLLQAWRPRLAASSAADALETALLDLAGKVTGLPCWRLLGATTCREVECNGTIGADDPVKAAELGRELAAKGFTSIKIKVGGDSSSDLARVCAVSEAVGPSVRLRVDANRCYSVEQAIAFVDGLGFELELAEQPCGSLADMRAVREATSVPVVADESVSDVTEARAAIEARACDAITAKLAKVGGPTAAVAIGGISPTYLSSALDSAIGIAAAAHTAQVLGAPRAARSRAFPTGLAHGLATSPLFSDNVAETTWLSGPSIQLPDEPGLGIEIDDSALDRLRIEI